MGVKRIVDTDFWNDDKVMELFSPEDKYFMLYLLTNPHTTQLGIYKINEKLMSFETGYEIGKVNNLIQKFENDYEMIRFNKKTKEMAIKNFLKHSIISGGRPVEDCINKEMKRVVDKSLIDYIFTNIKDYINLNSTIHKIINKYYILLNANDIDNDNDIQIQNDDSYNDSLKVGAGLILDYMNSVGNKDFKHIDSNLNLIIGKLKEGFTIEECKDVVYNQKREFLKSILKKGEKDLSRFYRPATLFGDNFESYLQDYKQYGDRSDVK